MTNNMEQPSTWPGSSILFWGTFGTSTPEGRRYHRRSYAALATLIAGHVVAAFLPSAAGRVITAFLPGLAFGFIGWEFCRYLNALDELARRIQLEAIAWTYLTGFTVACTLGPVMYTYDLAPAWANPLWFVLLEPLRGVWLYAVARRY